MKLKSLIITVGIMCLITLFFILLYLIGFYMGVIILIFIIGGCIYFDVDDFLKSKI